MLSWTSFLLSIRCKYVFVVLSTAVEGLPIAPNGLYQAAKSWYEVLDVAFEAFGCVIIYLCDKKGGWYSLFYVFRWLVERGTRSCDPSMSGSRLRHLGCSIRVERDDGKRPRGQYIILRLLSVSTMSIARRARAREPVVNHKLKATSTINHLIAISLDRLNTINDCLKKPSYRLSHGHYIFQ